MKKTTLLILAIFALGATNINAQGLAVGLKAGLNFAKLDIEDVDTESRTGYHFGAYGRINAVAGFGIQAEAYYSVQGGDIDVIGAKEAVDFGYLQIPILLRKSFVKVVDVHIGPQFGVLLSSSDDIDGFDIEDEIKSSDLSLAVGAGINLPFGLNGSVRYVHGLSDISDSQDLGSTSNSMFQISVGYDLFSIGND